MLALYLAFLIGAKTQAIIASAESPTPLQRTGQHLRSTLAAEEVTRSISSSTTTPDTDTPNQSGEPQ